VVAEAIRPRSRGRLRTLLRDSLLYGIGTMATRGASILLVPLLTRVLTATDYGVLDLAVALTYLLATVLSLGLDSAVWRFHPEAEGTDARSAVLPVALWTQAAICLLVVGALVAAAPAWVPALVPDHDATRVFQLGLAGVPFLVGLGTATSMFRARFDVRGANVIGLLQFAVVLSATLVVIVTHHRTPAAVMASTTLGYVVAFALAVWLLRGHLRERWSARLASAMLRYGLPLIPAAAALWALPYAGRYLLGHWRGPADVGLLAAASKPVTLLTLAFTAFQSAWGPFAVSIAEQSTARAVYARVLDYVLVLGALGAGTLSIFGSDVMRVIAPPSYASAAVLIPWLAFGTLATAAYLVTGIGAAITKRSWAVGTALLIAAAINIALAALLVPVFGAGGAAAATCVAMAISAILPPVIIGPVYAIPFSLRASAPTLVVAGVGAGLAVSVVPSGLALDLLFHFALTAMLLIPVARFLQHTGAIAIASSWGRGRNEAGAVSAASPEAR
jgi:O-antigen/teichoic acid export membrane protein